MESFKINDYEADCVRVFLTPDKLTLLYNFAVSKAVSKKLSYFVGVIFVNDFLLVDVRYKKEISECFEHLGIYPDVKMNIQWYDALLPF